MRKYYTIEDLDLFHNAKTLFYEIGQDGQPIKHYDLFGDDKGDLLHIGIRDNQFCICYYLLVEKLVEYSKIEECVAGQKLLLNLLNNGEIVPIKPDVDPDSIFNQLDESIIKENKYQPKLYLRFEPPIQNDSVGHNQLNKILNLIDNEYPETSWWQGQSAADYNPFKDEGEDRPDQVASLTIGYWPDGPNRLTYGQWDDNDMGHKNAIDGWQWLESREIDYDKTSDIFNQLDENRQGQLVHVPELTYEFEPPIEDPRILKEVINLLSVKHPGLKWINDKSILDYDIVKEVFRDNSGYDFVGSLTIGYFPEHPNQLTWSSLVDPNQSWGPVIDGWQLLKEYRGLEPEDIFNQLNESQYQPKLNLRFEGGISEAQKLEPVLKVLAMNYPNLHWKGGEHVLSYNPIIGDGDPDIYDDFEYDPIYYLTIGFFPTSPDKLTYTTAPIDDPGEADDEHDNFNWVDGWQWVEEHNVDYDKTTDIFNQLNESKASLPELGPETFFIFSPPIDDYETTVKILNAFQVYYPDLKWNNQDKITVFNPFKFHDETNNWGPNDSIYYFTFTFDGDMVWGTEDDYTDIDNRTISNSNQYNGWNFVERIGGLSTDTENFFD